MPLWIYKDGWKRVPKVWIYKDGWKEVPKIWIYKDGWKVVPMERHVTNYSLAPFKSDTNKDHASGVWNNVGSARTGSWGGYNYQGFMFGKPTKDSEGYSIGRDVKVTDATITLHRTSSSGYPPQSNTTMTIHSCTRWSGAPDKTPPSIPHGLSSNHIRFKPPELGQTKSYHITSSSELQVLTDWLTSDRYLCFWDPGDTVAYSSYEKIEISLTFS